MCGWVGVCVRARGHVRIAWNAAAGGGGCFPPTTPRHTVTRRTMGRSAAVVTGGTRDGWTARRSSTTAAPRSVGEGDHRQPVSGGREREATERKRRGPWGTSTSPSPTSTGTGRVAEVSGDTRSGLGWQSNGPAIVGHRSWRHLERRPGRGGGPVTGLLDTGKLSQSQIIPSIFLRWAVPNGFWGCFGCKLAMFGPQLCGFGRAPWERRSAHAVPYPVGGEGGRRMPCPTLREGGSAGVQGPPATPAPVPKTYSVGPMGPVYRN